MARPAGPPAAQDLPPFHPMVQGGVRWRTMGLILHLAEGTARLSGGSHHRAGPHAPPLPFRRSREGPRRRGRQHRAAGGGNIASMGGVSVQDPDPRSPRRAPTGACSGPMRRMMGRMIRRMMRRRAALVAGFGPGPAGIPGPCGARDVRQRIAGACPCRFCPCAEGGHATTPARDHRRGRGGRGGSAARTRGAARPQHRAARAAP